MDSFDSTESKTHIKENYVIDNLRMHKLYVKCDDGFWTPDENSGTFDLYVDNSRPVIKVFEADPSSIWERPVETNLIVGTDDETICKYGEDETDYDSMTGKFHGFDEFDFSTSHQQTISNLSDDTINYVYYVACKNKAGLVSDPSDSKGILVSVNLNQELTIDASPEKRYINKLTTHLNITTNKDAVCSYSENLDNINEDNGNDFSSTGGKTHRELLTFQTDGNYKYYVKCYKGGDSSLTKTIDFIVDTIPISTPVVNDTSDIEDYPEYSYRTDKLRVKWELDEKPASGVDYYSYMLEDESSNIIVDWTESTEEDEWVLVDEDHDGDELNLIDGTTYFFNVKAKNMVGSWSEIGKSDGVIIDTSKEPVSCSNGIQDGEESDVDCGGSCDECDLTNKCVEDSDCHSGFCNSSNKCAKPSCSDETKNGDETDVDCGGDECSKTLTANLENVILILKCA